jgi:hypothetical protein
MTLIAVKRRHPIAALRHENIRFRPVAARADDTATS